MKAFNHGFYAGSFDPFTNGHLEIVKKAAKIFDTVDIGIAKNPDKHRRFTVPDMLDAIILTLHAEGIKNVSVIAYDGLTSSVAKEHQTTYFIRGIRNGIDYQYEENLSSVNEEISGIDTLYFRAGKFGNISSSMVYELWKNGVDISKYVPLPVHFLMDSFK